MPTAARRTITAFLDGPDSPGISNPIHSTGVARAYGFEAALVGGVTVFGWCVPAILVALGEEWLDFGWADVSFRRPVYPGDVITASVEGDGPVKTLAVTNSRGERCLVGEVGAGEGPWLAQLALPARPQPEPVLEHPPELTLETAGRAVGHALRPMSVACGHEEMAEYAANLQLDTAPRWTGPEARLHPGWLAARMTPLLKHSYRYAPSIHIRSQVQNLRPAFAGGSVTVAGRLVAAYERNGHHIAELDGVILSEAGIPVTRIRHTTIFRPRPVGPPPGGP